MTTDRERRIIIILGAKVYGKTVLAEHFAARYPGDVRILDPSYQWPTGEWPVQPGHKRRDDIRAWLSKLTNEGRGGWEGLLILDDWDRYVNVLPGEEWTDLMVANRHQGIDVIAIGHRPQGLPKEAIMNADDLFIFHTPEPRAREYYLTIYGLEALDLDLIPTERGKALHVNVQTGEYRLYEVPPPLVSNDQETIEPGAE